MSENISCRMVTKEGKEVWVELSQSQLKVATDRALKKTKDYHREKEAVRGFTSRIFNW